jgi:lipopolysaccharide/colanic/teichoic acid biosynthesis glycosyltransferase
MRYALIRSIALFVGSLLFAAAMTMAREVGLSYGASIAVASALSCGPFVLVELSLNLPSVPEGILARSKCRPIPPPPMAAWITSSWKRGFDIALSSCVLLLLGPMLAFVAACIRLETRGPAIVKIRRVGRSGHLYHALRFRTYRHENADREGGFVASSDPGLTRVGKVLRRTRTYKAMEFVNVWLGHASVVGPGPMEERFADAYGLDYTEEERAALLRARPGLTHWSFVWYGDDCELLGDAKAVDLDYVVSARPRWLDAELDYLASGSLLMDLRIIVATLTVLWNGRRALPSPGGGSAALTDSPLTQSEPSAGRGVPSLHDSAMQGGTSPDRIAYASSSRTMFYRGSESDWDDRSATWDSSQVSSDTASFWDGNISSGGPPWVAIPA